MRPLVVLRPEPGASTTADAARRLGLEPILIPLFRIEPVAWTAPDLSDFDGLLITSANAVRFAGPELRKLCGFPAYAVGEATAAAAREEGFRVEAVGSGGVDALLGSIAPSLRLLHLCGTDRREPAAPSQNITARPVYRSIELPRPEGLERIQSAVVMVHSPRTAMRLAELAEQMSLPRHRTAIAAISWAAAAAAGDGWERVEAPNEPNNQALLALATRLCQNAAQWTRQTGVG